MAFSLHSVEIENLRGYFSAQLNLSNPRTVIVGPNNSGKTSVLRLLNWVLTELNLSRIQETIVLSSEEQAFLLPARDARHRARRLTLLIHVSDARSWNKFKCEGGIAKLRVNIRLTPHLVAYVALADPKRGESAESDPSAVELLARLRSELNYIYIPSFRDARSERFETTLQEAFRGRIEERALHSGRAGAPKEHREVAKNKQQLEKILLDLVSPIWEEVRVKLPPGMARAAKIDFDCDQATFLEFLESKLRFRISTGSHDQLAVPINELGSGLQSILDLAFQDGSIPAGQTARNFMVVEEPEAFLHPSAQRTVAQRLLNVDDSRQVLITTHSPVVVEEARFGDLVLCRDHTFYHPASVSVEARDAINTALLSGYGAEMAFGNAILLVEGESDRQFFEIIRRRISVLDETGALDTCFVVPVGSKERFAPWIRLLRAYGDEPARPIRWLMVPDGDACKDIRRANADAGQSLTSQYLQSLTAADGAYRSTNVPQWRNRVADANRIARAEGLPVHMLQCDLEEAILGSAGKGLTDAVKAAARWEDNISTDELLRRLGSKAFGGNSNGKKDVYLRALIAREIRPREITRNIRVALKRWFALVMAEGKAESLLRRWEA